MASLSWYWHRLRVMNAAELAGRLGEQALLQYLRCERWWRFRAADAGRWRHFAFCSAPNAVLPLPLASVPDAEESRSLLAGDWGALGYSWQWSGAQSAWHRAPDTGRRWPLRYFAAIDHRTDNPHGDARVIWEPARLQALVELALIARDDPQRAPEAARLIERALDSWIRANPYLLGVHYVSAMECALRLIAVCHALDVVRGRLGQPEATWANFLWLLETHATLIARRLSRHSSAGNHLIAECAGLVYAASVLPEHPRARAWRRVGLAVLQAEAGRQVLDDGGGIEQAPWYHLFVVDLLGLVQELLAARHQAVPPAITAAVARGRAFLAALGERAERLPRIGDADDGFALTRHLRVSFAGRPRPSAPVQTFPTAGYTLWRSPPLEVLSDHGPLGMAPACGHGHADALAVLVRHGDAELLIDPGTYAYNGGVAWRRYFRGTRAHNTVTVDGLDQAVQEGAFLWSSPFARPRVESFAGGLLMCHDGYRRLGVVHWRAVVLRDGQLLVWDLLEGEGQHDFELNWHLGSDPVQARVEEGEFHFDCGYRLLVRGGDCALLKGSSEPLAGWGAPGYGRRAPIPTVRTSRHAGAPHEFVTLLVPNSADVTVEAALGELRRLKSCLQSA
jgi:uncharacterized heparinase superfamily protein